MCVYRIRAHIIKTQYIVILVQVITLSNYRRRIPKVNAIYNSWAALMLNRTNAKQSRIQLTILQSHLYDRERTNESAALL